MQLPYPSSSLPHHILLHSEIVETAFTCSRLLVPSVDRLLRVILEFEMNRHSLRWRSCNTASFCGINRHFPLRSWVELQIQEQARGVQSAKTGDTHTASAGAAA